MKYLNKITVLLIFALAFVACDENENFEILPKQDSFQIVTPSSGTVMELLDENLLNEALFLSWEDINGPESASYTIEVAETGTDFASTTVLGTSASKNFSINVDELNTFLLNDLEVPAEEATSLDVRVVENNRITPIIAIVLTPFKVEYTELYVVGNITDPQWSPADALSMINTGFNEFVIVLDLEDGAEFKFLPTNIDYEGDLGEDPNNAGFLIEEGEVNISGYPAGRYRVSVDLNTFTFELEEIVQRPRLAVPGNHQGWSPGTAPQLEASSDNTTDYEGYLWLDGEHKFVAPDANGIFDWNAGPDYGDDGTFTGKLVEQDEKNCNATTGYYFVKADTDALTYSEIEVSWGIIGSATPGGWDYDTDLTYDPETQTLIGDVDLVAGGFKFRGNNEWDNGFDLGNVDANGNLQNGGDLTFDQPDGNYKVVLDLSNPRAYTYSITPNF